MPKGESKKVRVLAGVSIFLFATSVAAVGYVFHLRSDVSSLFKNPYPFVDPARSLIDQKHFFSTIEPLRQELFSIVDSYEKDGSRIGVYFEFLNTGANISINQESRFWPASLIKMPTALVVMKKVERGEWKLSNELVLMAEDKNDDFGSLYKNPTGTRFTIEDLLKELIIHSDDTAHRILTRNLSSEEFEEMLTALGMEEMYDKNYDITAKEYSRVFRALYSSSFLKREYSQTLLSWLSETQFNEFLDSGVPDTVPFAHKIGEHDLQQTYLDSGIVYVPERPYLITVMVDAKTSGGRETAKKIMQDVSAAAYAYVANN